MSPISRDRSHKHPVSRGTGSLYLSVDNGSWDIRMKDVEESTKAYATMQADSIESVTWRRVNKAASMDQEWVSLVHLIVYGFSQDE